MTSTDLKWKLSKIVQDFVGTMDYANLNLHPDGYSLEDLFSSLEEVEEVDNFFLELPSPVWQGKDSSEYFDTIFVSKNMDGEWSIQTRMNGSRYINWWRENCKTHHTIISRGFIPKHFSSEDFSQLMGKFIRAFSLESFK